MCTPEERLEIARKHLASSPAAVVMFCTYTHRFPFHPRHVDLLRVRGGDLEMQRGKRWVSLNFASMHLGQRN